jgi:tetratricopeptide (TPR) repeat protein
MVTAPEIGKRAIKEASERLEKASTAEHAPALEARFPQLLKRIKDGTLGPGDIDDFLRKEANLPPDLKQYLLSRKAWFLLRGEETKDALRAYDEALAAAPESPTTWLMKGSALLELNRLDDAFQAFQKAYSLREHFGPQKQEYLKDLFLAWSLAAQLRGLFGILNKDSNELGKGVEAYLQALENSRKVGLDGAISVLEVPESASQELKDALEELLLAIRLLSIKNPFERVRELAKEVTKVWPEGVPAVEAVREQRDREWTN